MLLIIIGVWLGFQATVGQLPARIKAWNTYLGAGGGAGTTDLSLTPQAANKLAGQLLGPPAPAAPKPTPTQTPKVTVSVTP
jgi:hypothetical protein